MKETVRGTEPEEGSVFRTMSSREDRLTSTHPSKGKWPVSIMQFLPPSQLSARHRGSLKVS